jgi:hypothetical protein
LGAAELEGVFVPAMSERHQQECGPEICDRESAADDGVYVEALLLIVLLAPWLLYLVLYFGNSEALEFPVGAIFSLFVVLPHLLASVAIPLYLYWRRRVTEVRQFVFRLSLANLLMIAAAIFFSI